MNPASKVSGVYLCFWLTDVYKPPKFHPNTKWYLFDSDYTTKSERAYGQCLNLTMCAAVPS